ncbi:hypothetical protein Q3G72_034198 [Acer saccharum]|nr:hypothetical protein Q3G72_034198 [Acer saccharum]
MYLISGYWVPYFMYLFRNTEFKKYSPVVYGEFVEFVDREFDLDPMFPLQTIKLDETSIEGVRNILNKLISVHNIGGLLMSFDQRYWNKINQYNYIEHGIGLLDANGRLAQRSFTFVDDEGSRKKVEEDVLRLYPQLAGLDTLWQEAVSKGKLQRNKRHRRKEKTEQFAGRIGYQT